VHPIHVPAAAAPPLLACTEFVGVCGELASALAKGDGVGGVFSAGGWTVQPTHGTGGLCSVLVDAGEAALALAGVGEGTLSGPLVVSAGGCTVQPTHGTGGEPASALSPMGGRVKSVGSAELCDGTGGDEVVDVSVGTVTSVNVGTAGDDTVGEEGEEGAVAGTGSLL